MNFFSLLYFLGITAFLPAMRGRLVAAGLVSRSAGPGDHSWLATELTAVFALGMLPGAALLYSAASGDEVGSGLWGGYAAFGLLLVPWLHLRRVPRAAVLDGAAIAVPTGMAVAKLACLSAGCCHGLPTSAPWAISYQSSVNVANGIRIHPTQIYDAAVFAAAALACLLTTKLQALRGRLVLLAVVTMGAGRFVTEFFRGDARPLLGSVPTAQIVALGAAGAALAIMWVPALRKEWSRFLASGGERIPECGPASAASGGSLGGADQSSPGALAGRGPGIAPCLLPPLAVYMVLLVPLLSDAVVAILALRALLRTADVPRRAEMLARSFPWALLALSSRLWLAAFSAVQAAEPSIHVACAMKALTHKTYSMAIHQVLCRAIVGVALFLNLTHFPCIVDPNDASALGSPAREARGHVLAEGRAFCRDFEALTHLAHLPLRAVRRLIVLVRKCHTRRDHQYQAHEKATRQCHYSSSHLAPPPYASVDSESNACENHPESAFSLNVVVSSRPQTPSCEERTGWRRGAAAAEGGWARSKTG